MFDCHSSLRWRLKGDARQPSLAARSQHMCRWTMANPARKRIENSASSVLLIASARRRGRATVSRPATATAPRKALPRSSPHTDTSAEERDRARAWRGRFASLGLSVPEVALFNTFSQARIIIRGVCAHSLRALATRRSAPRPGGYRRCPRTAIQGPLSPESPRTPSPNTVEVVPSTSTSLTLSFVVSAIRSPVRNPSAPR